MILNVEDDIFYFADLFCGAGGTTCGLHNAVLDGKQLAKVFACVNHDANAIKSHYLNNPYTKHFTEDIRILNISPIIKQVENIRKKSFNANVCIWASLECTNFSKAKGGQARDADSRTLAEHLYRYIEGINPSYIFIENVEEFMDWGPLNKKKKPIKRLKGTSYRAWVEHVKSYGYDYEFRILNSADYGAHTSRKRYFGLFAKKGMPIIFPEATYSKAPEKNKNKSLKKWKPIKEVLDFNDEGKSIFAKKKPLSPRTIDRIFMGLVKHVVGGKEEFLKVYREAYKNGNLAKYKNIKDIKNFIPEDFDINTIDKPDYWLDKQYSGNENHQSIDRPAGSIMTNDKHCLMKVEHFIARQFSGGGQHQSINSPSGSLLTVPKMQLVSAKWIMNSNYNNPGNSIDQPSPSLLASRRHYYIMNPQWFGGALSINKPSPTLIARQDKAPLYLITTNSGRVVIGVYKEDSKPMVKLKKIMVLYDIVDIKMRMLKVPELLKIQGFPVTYKLFGTQNDQKKFIGNSVTPIVPERWIEALYGKLVEIRKAA